MIRTLFKLNNIYGQGRDWISTAVEIQSLQISLAVFVVFFSMLFGVNVFGATEFVSIIDPDNGTGTDYTSLSAWEAAVQSDLTAVSTLVFSYTNASSTIPDSVTVVGQLSGAVASSTHMTASSSATLSDGTSGSSQILLTNISGTFQNGEQVYVQSTGASSTYVFLADTGNPAIAVAKCRSTGGSPDTTAVIVDGWATATSTYVKIWTDPDDPYGRHNGKWDEGKYILSVGLATGYSIKIKDDHTILDGLQIESLGDANYDSGGIITQSATEIFISNNFVKYNYTGPGSHDSEGIYMESLSGETRYCYNNIVVNVSGVSGTTRGIAGNYGTTYYYNNTVFGFNRGISGSTIQIIINNLSSNNSSSDYYGVTSGTRYNNISSDGTAPGINSKASTTVQFIDAENGDFHLSPNDTAARNAGTSTVNIPLAPFEGGIAYDIDGTARGGAFDIGADEVPVEFVSTICEAGASDCSVTPDYNSLYTWEDKVESDLTASTTRVFSGSLTGNLSENNLVELYVGGADSGIDGYVVATTSAGQILIDGIIGTSSPLITASGTQWRYNDSTSNMWTVSGTGDDLGASPQATARIDGTWNGSDDNPVIITGWSSDYDNYIKIYTTTSARHNGKWDETKYRLNIVNAVGISSDERSVLIDGLQIWIISNSTYDRGISFRGNLNNSRVIAKNNIIKGTVNNTNAYHRGISIWDLGLNNEVYILNNIVYNFNGNNGECIDPIDNQSYTKSFVFNNTVYNCDYGFSESNAILKNNISFNNNDNYYLTFHSSSTNNISGPDQSDAPGSNPINNATIQLISTASGTEDFHLVETDTTAKNAGVDLSTDPAWRSAMLSDTEIDGGPRNVDGLGWDIGADELATKIYRSVGNTTANLNTSNRTVTISSSTRIATFSSTMPDNVGVGDVIQFGTGSYDLAFITGRIDSSNYYVQNYQGGAPSATTTATAPVYRAHLELDDWEDQVVGDVNSGISDSVDDLVLVGQDLVASNTIMMAAAYASTAGDDVSFSIDGWTTGAGNYIKIYTPKDSDEVGVSQRHDGKWDDNKYNLTKSVSADFTAAITIRDDFVKIVGLQLKQNAGSKIYVRVLHTASISSIHNLLEITDNLIEFQSTVHATSRAGINIEDVDSNANIFNNIVYLSGVKTGVGIDVAHTSVGDISILNNTVLGFINCYDGRSTVGVVAINNIAQNCTDGFIYTFDTTSNYNISSVSADAPGANSKNSTTVQFVDTANNDFHLAPTDTAALDAGTSTLGSLSLSGEGWGEVAYDIDGHYRRTWDIGADEASVEFVSTVMESGGDFSSLSSWEAANQVDLTATTTAVFGCSTATGTIPVGSTVIGETTGAIASTTVMSTTSAQILLYNITASSTTGNEFVSGEKVYIQGGSTSDNYCIISDNGNPAIAVAKIDGAWTISPDTRVIVDGWTTGKNNYVKIYTTSTARHTGAINTGFKLDRNGANGEILQIKEDYTIIDGLELTDVADHSTSYIIWLRSRYNTIKNNLIYNDTLFNNGRGIYSHFGDSAEKNNIFNNIILNMNNGIYARYDEDVSVVINNTVYNANVCYYSYASVSNTGSTFSNNIGQNCVTGFELAGNGTWNDSNFNASNDNSAPGANSIKNAIVTFVSTSTGDFHLSINDTAARNAGTSTVTELSSVAELSSVLIDIDGHARPADYAWDIGADEAPAEIYRSVGPSNTSALSNGQTASTSLAISGYTATFGAAQPLNVGVGDALQYDSDGDNSVNALAFIRRRSSSTEYWVVNASGTPPTAITGTTSQWQIFRAYTSLTNAETGTENTGLADALENFDTWSGGRDLVSNNEQWSVALYADNVFDGRTPIEGWTTGTSSYIRVFAPYKFNEVGITQRHSGKWDSSKVLLQMSSNDYIVLEIREDFVDLDGLQILQGRNADAVVVYDPYVNPGATINISNNIIRATGSGISNSAIEIQDISPDFSVNIWNNIIYDFSSGYGIRSGDKTNEFIYNNTIFNCSYSYNSTGAQGLRAVKNNISQNSTYGFDGTFHSSSDYNISDIEGDAPNATYTTASTSVTFVDEANDDFHLALADTGARNKGVDLSNTPLAPLEGGISLDIDGEMRGVGSTTALNTGWDIGADQSPVDFVSKIRSSFTTGDYDKLSTWEAAIDSDLTTKQSRVFTVSNLGTYATSTDDGLAVTFSNNATGTLMHINKDNLAYITGVFSYPAVGTTTLSNGHVFVISDVGIQVARAVAECYNDWPSGLEDMLYINGWDVGINNYVKVFTPSSERHSGVAKSGSNYIGFAIKANNTDSGVVRIQEAYTLIDGLILDLNQKYNTDGILSNVGDFIIKNNIIFNGPTCESCAGIDASSGYGSGIKIVNNIIYDLQNGIRIYWGGNNQYYYNNTLKNNVYGVRIYGSNMGYNHYFYNNLSDNNLTGDFVNSSSDNLYCYNCVSSDGTADDFGGTGNRVNQAFKFVDEANDDFHLAYDDTGAKDQGTDLSDDPNYSSPCQVGVPGGGGGQGCDIDRENRVAWATTSQAWDIGADEAPSEFVSRIRVGSEPDADFTLLSTWEAAIQSDLTASTTQVFAISTSTGSIAAGSTVVGLTSGAIASSTWITPRQIFLTNVKASTTLGGPVPGTYQAFVSGEKVYIQGGSPSTNFAILASYGTPAIAVAEAYNDWESGLDDSVEINGWVTGAKNIIKIYAPSSEKHTGIPGTGFFLEDRSSTYYTLRIREGYVYLKDIEIRGGYNGEKLGIYYSNPGGDIYQTIDSVLFYDTDSTATIFYLPNYSTIRNTTFICSGACGHGVNFNNYGNYTTIDNVTISGFTTGINMSNKSTAILRNAIAYNNSTDFANVSTISASSGYNASSDSTAPGTNAITGITSDCFVGSANNDFRLMPECELVDSGTSSPSTLFTDDIVGTARPTNLAWDIGAFEAPQIMYRSVGNDSRDLAPASTTVTISTAYKDNIVFSQPVPDNVGVGDVVEIGTSSSDLVIIHGRTSSTTFSGRTAGGSGTTATTSAPASIYRAHLKLENWEAQTTAKVNPSVASGLRSNILVGQDLVASNTAIFIAAYASSSPDDTSVSIQGWTTGTSSYIKIYTPTELTEVGETQRHSGIWDNSKFSLVISDTSMILPRADYVKIAGLQLNLNVNSDILSAAIYIPASINPQNKIEIESNIIRGNIISGNNYNEGITVNDVDAVVYIKNNLIYGFKGDNKKAGAWVTLAKETHYYNNTITDNYYGLHGVNGYPDYATNNAVFNNVDDFNTFDTIDYNASDDLDGTNPIDISPAGPRTEAESWKAAFVDYENYDFRVRDIASPLYDAGTTITIITDDIAGNPRPYHDAYDVGAFEFSNRKPKYRFNGTFRFDLGSFRFQ